MGAVKAALPQLRRARLVGLLGIAASLALVFMAIQEALLQPVVSPWVFGLVIALNFLPTAFALYWMESLQRRIILPRLAAMAGLDMPAKITRQMTNAMRDRLRTGLLPDAGRLKVQAFAVGHLGKRELIYSQIRIPGRGEDDDIFQGIILTLPHLVPMPEHHLVARALLDQNRPVHTFHHHLATQQIWPDYFLFVSQGTDAGHPLLPNIIDRHIRIPNQFDPSASLLSSICDGHQTQLAIRCKRGFSDVGGLFLSIQRLEAQVGKLMQDFSTVYAAAGLLLEAESMILSQNPSAT